MRGEATPRENLSRVDVAGPTLQRDDITEALVSKLTSSSRNKHAMSADGCNDNALQKQETFWASLNAIRWFEQMATELRCVGIWKRAEVDALG